MNDKFVLNTLADINGWFKASTFFKEDTTNSDKVTVLNILLNEYAEEGLLLAKKMGNEWYFIHPTTQAKLIREYKINQLLAESSLPLRDDSILGMIDGCRLNLSQLQQKLGYDDTRKVKKWLFEHGINLQSNGRDKVVYEFLVDLEIQLDIVKELRKMYPLKWHQIYAVMSNCEKMTKTVFQIFPPEVKPKKSIPNKPYKKRIK